ncbi:hypothetical protein SPRG_13712 [Saprolegnia parasitica CBS 223.65]|uniref:Phospholipid-transporting ATPase n=1 Tax=Saprolegnia parasitica (strain CBS 223.65) TaxID=695850 RepID=A0A067C3V9_SAPPC|nr:hypothetical protein SPRG_13712 [Saprolegnia parasitica CBS 223.65]KDO21211.1 hypothetical protein SPRG_13712 [Saprolegnia parasitica CBS 223.65]|eukprot:XP_012208046.1 hypothetical protein SPRG_13712 [Saprolegnia parasitica CBS 223.65]
MFKQGLEDKKRHDADAIQNSRLCTVVTAGGKLVSKKWQDVLVGDILFLKDKDELPADILILATSEEEGRCFVETCNLDGETNLKRRTGLEPIAKLVGFRGLSDAVMNEEEHKASCAAFQGSIEYEQPNNRLYNFTGRIQAASTGDAVPIGPNNIILRGCSIRSCAYVFGVVLFAGKETKLMQNARATPSKQSNVYRMVNRCIVLIFMTQFLLCIISTLSFNSWVSDYKQRVWYLPFIEADGTAFFTFLILYNNLVPISLYVSLDMVKVAQAKNISSDPEMCHEGFHAIARTSDLNEDLGQIEYIFSDKTGTLTQNIMEFRKCSIGGVVYGYGSTEIAAAVALLAKKDTSSALKPKEPEGDIDAAQIFRDKTINFDDPRLVHELATQGPNADKIRDFLTLLSVCHTVIPEANATTGAVNYRASSPDEEALVKAARCLGFNLKTPAPLLEVDVTLAGQTAATCAYTILNVNEFNSTRKRMSVVAQFPDDRLVLLCKGADNVILPRCKKDEFSTNLDEQLRNFATEGLRTLVLAQRELSIAEYDAWNAKYQEAATSLVNRDQMLDDVAELLEVNMDIVGATAIEDKLQVGVPRTIFNLAQAGIKIWVLTGDKEETAVNIGHACRLLDDGMKLLYINRENIDDLVAQIDYLFQMPTIQDLYKKKAVSNDMAVVCDGKSLVHLFPAKATTQSDAEKATAKELRRKLLVVASVCKALIACRVSPAQKADIVNLVRFNSVNKPITLAIGDGANDVNMIQSAHVGIGICGQEGVQAVNASDYAIAQFRFLERLLLVHGRSNYKRIAKVILYSFYKNMSLVIVLFLFNFFNGQSGSSLFESFVLAGWNFFLALPIISIGVFDQDVNPEQALAFPPLYMTGQRNEDLNVKCFLLWIANAIYHAFVSFWIPLYIVPAYTAHSFYLQGTTIYSGLLMTMNAKVILETLCWTRFSYAVLAFSILLFFFFLLVYPHMTFLGTDMFGVTPIMLGADLYWTVFFLIPVAGILVDVSLTSIYRMYWPTEANILRERSALKKVDQRLTDFSSRKGLASQSFVDNEGDEKAGVRNLEMRSYKGFAFSAPDDKQATTHQTSTGASVREIATLRVDQLSTGRRLSDTQSMHGPRDSFKANEARSSTNP